jgi:hypothetical protein
MFPMKSIRPRSSGRPDVRGRGLPGDDTGDVDLQGVEGDGTMDSGSVHGYPS